MRGLRAKRRKLRWQNSLRGAEEKRLMKIRYASDSDLLQILPIYENARAFMASYGNAGQWGEGYPQKELLEQDIRQKRLYVCEEEGKITAVFMFFIGEEPTYRRIENGSWPNDRPYGTVHRLASAGLIPHMADFIFDWCCEQCRKNNADLRGDTHEKNHPMLNAFARNGFARCGIIYVRDGSSRIAWQKEVGGCIQ